MRTVLTLLAMVGLAAGGVVYYRTQVASGPVANFRTVAVKRGDLLSTISATGTVQAEEFVDVGAQVVGRILDFGIDQRPERQEAGRLPRKAREGQTRGRPRRRPPGA
jgi:HlyD family secretion protein